MKRRLTIIHFVQEYLEDSVYAQRVCTCRL